MTSQEILSLTDRYIMHTYGRFPVAIDHGKGATLYDPEGNAYIDFTSGIGVSDLGYGNHAWADAIARQAQRLGHASNLFCTEPPARLAEVLCKRTGMSCAFFANGGGEANEGLIKLARKYSFDRYGKGRSAIVTLNNSFHGRTITTLTATGQEVFPQLLLPLHRGVPGTRTPMTSPLLEAQGDDVVRRVMMELVQGEGGVLPLDRDYVHAVAKLCAERDWLLLIDEVQTGVGRTGSLFAFQQYGIAPDAVSFAKGIAGGLPMSGILANEKCRDVLTPGNPRHHLRRKPRLRRRRPCGPGDPDRRLPGGRPGQGHVSAQPDRGAEAALLRRHPGPGTDDRHRGQGRVHQQGHREPAHTLR